MRQARCADTGRTKHSAQEVHAVSQSPGTEVPLCTAARRRAPCFVSSGPGTALSHGSMAVSECEKEIDKNSATHGARSTLPPPRARTSHTKPHSSITAPTQPRSEARSRFPGSDFCVSCFHRCCVRTCLMQTYQAMGAWRSRRTQHVSGHESPLVVNWRDAVVGGDTQAVAASCHFNSSTVSSAGHEGLLYLHSGRTRRTVVTPTHTAWRGGGRLFQRRSYAALIWGAHWTRSLIYESALWTVWALSATPSATLAL